jgi:hypothetical protein
VIAAIYFVSALVDVGIWYAADGPASSRQLATFFAEAELSEDARWMVSPLYLWDALFAGSSLSESATVYRIYLLIGVGLALLVAASDFLPTLGLPDRLGQSMRWSWPVWLLWVWFVGWANRIALLAGTVEPILSMSLAALAIAPIGTSDLSAGSVQRSWRVALATHLIAVQATLLAVMTTALLVSAPVWWNGIGAYALVAPTESRLLDVRGTFFETPWVFEGLTAWLVCSLPLGLFRGWRPGTRRIGVGLMIAWCVIVGLLSANVLYAATFAVMATTIGLGQGDESA